MKYTGIFPKDDKDNLKEYYNEKQECFVKIINNCKIFEFDCDKKDGLKETLVKMKCGVC